MKKGSWEEMCRADIFKEFFGDVLGTFFKQLHMVRKDSGFVGEVMNPKMGRLKVNPKKIPKEIDYLNLFCHIYFFTYCLFLQCTTL